LWGDKLLLGFPLYEVTEAYLTSHASHPTVPLVTTAGAECVVSVE